MAAIESIPLSEIRLSTKRTEQITVRVTRLWCKKNDTVPVQIQGVEINLVDQEGETIQATIKNKLVKIFLESLNEGDTYKIRKFSVSSNRVGLDMATYHPCKIWFEYSTRVIPINNTDIPLSAEIFYTFKEFYFGAMPDRLYVDVIGKLEHVYPIVQSNNGKNRMKMILKDNENQQLCCTLFGEYVNQVREIEERFKGQTKPTLVLLHIKRSVYEGEVSITTTWGATKILVNPDMYAVRSFNRSFEEAGLANNQAGEEAYHPPILASANIKSLDEIEKLRRGGAYVTMATFVELDTSGMGWYYNSCKECRSKVQQKEDELWYCEKERETKNRCSLKGIGTQSATPRFQVKFYVTYENTNLCEFIIWDDAMAELLGKTAQEILDEDEIFKLMPPPDFKPLIEKEFIVKIRVNQIFNIEQNSHSYGVISLCGDPRTIKQWKQMHATTKEPAISGLTSTSKDSNKSNSMMEKMREMMEDEPVTESEDTEVTPQRGATEEKEPSDKSSATKLQEIKSGKAPM